MTALVILIEIWIAKGYGRTLRIQQLAAMAKITFISLLVLEGVRIADLIVRGQLHRMISTPKSGYFLAEILLGTLPLSRTSGDPCAVMGKILKSKVVTIASAPIRAMPLSGQSTVRAL